MYFSYFVQKMIDLAIQDEFDSKKDKFGMKRKMFGD